MAQPLQRAVWQHLSNSKLHVLLAFVLEHTGNMVYVPDTHPGVEEPDPVLPLLFILRSAPRDTFCIVVNTSAVLEAD